MIIYTRDEQESALQQLNKGCEQEWVIKDNCLYRLFEFSNFLAAFSFMTKVALLAEKANHHPDWCNSYSRVEVNLTTHEVGKLTSRDFELASAINLSSAST